MGFPPTRHLSSKVALGLLFLAVCAVAEITPVNLAQLRFTNVVSGLDYAHLRDSAAPWSIHIARLDRSQRELRFLTTQARQRVNALAPMSAQIAELPTALGRPLAAINGDFFAIQPGPYQGDPDGLQISGGEVSSAPNDKTFWISTNGEPRIGVLYSRFEVVWPAGNKTRLGLNQAPLTNAATLFTSRFGDATHATNQTELVLEREGESPWLPLRLNATYRALVREVRPHGNTTLVSNEMVLVLNGTATTNLPHLRPGDTLTLTTTTSTNIGNITTAIGGAPILIKHGAVQPWPSRKGILDYLQPRHPRSAIGYNDRYVFLVAVDGRQPGLSAGMSFVELSALMLQLGCTDALNLDGGGSTTFWLNGKVLNSPSDKRERSIANALVIVQSPP